MSEPSTQDYQAQPGPSSTFSATHANPFPQQQAYVPPSQYGTLNPQETSSDSLTAQLEIKQIDQQLSSGWYSCYRCWLYFMIVVCLLTFVDLFYNYGLTLGVIPYTIEFFVMANYAIAMIGALKNKDLGRAKNGYKLASAFLVIMALLLLVNSWLVWTQYSGTFQVKYFTGIVPGTLIYSFFVIYNPAAKVVGHLERRETLLQQTTSPYNA